MSAIDSTSTSSVAVAASPGRRDWMVLTKARLSGMVAVTTFFGYWVGSRAVGGSFSFSTLLHTLFGTLLCAFGSAVFNQLMETDLDAKMKRTEDRPLPAGRLNPAIAFIVGALLSAVGLLHLNAMVNFESCVFAALTLITYIFIYTPMKQRSSFNTVVGAVSGALPPLIGWMAAFGQIDGFRWELAVAPQAVFLFGLLFLWQMPHFLAINWMYREEYVRGGFVMWSNTDDTGAKTAKLALFFSLCQLALMVQPQVAGFASWVFTVGGLLASAVIVWLSWKFLQVPDRSVARRLFLSTLLHLPIVLALLILGLRSGAR